MKITIEGANVDDLAQSLADLMFRREWDEEAAGESLERRVAKILNQRTHAVIDAEVAKAMREYTVERARAVVDEFIAEGITQTDEYGNAKRRIPWKEFIISTLTRSGYQREGVAGIAREAVEALWKTQLKGVLDEVTASVRAQVDEMVGAKIKEAIRNAVGVK